MGIFTNLKNAFARFMYGRNGVDKLGIHMIWVALILDILSTFIVRHNRFFGSTLYWMAMVMIGYEFFRMFSRNLGRRREENQKYLNWLWKMKSRNSGAKARHADKEHKYFTCKSCGTICRVPAGKGEIVITCPKCGAKIRGKS